MSNEVHSGSLAALMYNFERVKKFFNAICRVAFNGVAVLGRFVMSRLELWSDLCTVSGFRRIPCNLFGISRSIKTLTCEIAAHSFRCVGIFSLVVHRNIAC